MGGLIAALWKLGILTGIGTSWTLIAIMIAIEIGIMPALASRGSKGNVQIDRK